MNITEANAVNVVLRHLLDLPGPGGDVPTELQAQVAGITLADQAHKVLSAGLTGADVDAAWPEIRTVEVPS